MLLGAVLFLVVSCLATYPAPALGGGMFTIGGRGVAPQEIHFAGARHPSPVYRVQVQVNHDTRSGVSVELTLVDDALHVLRAQHHREPYFPPDALPVVFIADVKMQRFLAGPERLLFGRLEGEIKKQQDVYPVPNAIFITDAVLADAGRLRAALQLGLGYLFNFDFFRAVVGLDHALPRPAD